MSDEHNTINHPNHYTWHPSGVECKDIIEEFSYHVGTAMGYLWRHEYKNGIEDLKKAVQHIQFEIERLEDKQLDNKFPIVNIVNNTINVPKPGTPIYYTDDADRERKLKDMHDAIEKHHPKDTIIKYF